MDNENKDMLASLQMAIEMETDARAFYLGAIKTIKNLFARELLQLFADEEQLHHNNIVQIRKAVHSGKGWPVLSARPGLEKKFKELLNGTCKSIGIDEAAKAIPMHILDNAIDQEDKGYNLYKEKADHSASELEKSFFTALANEERAHYLTLVDYKEFVEDPAGWFTNNERWSMEG